MHRRKRNPGGCGPEDAPAQCRVAAHLRGRQRRKGIAWDRDNVIKCVAPGEDPRSTREGEPGEGKPVTTGADDGIEEAIKTVQQHRVRRLPVIDGHALVGMPNQSDIAKNHSEDRVGDLVKFISFD